MKGCNRKVDTTQDMICKGSREMGTLRKNKKRNARNKNTVIETDCC